MNKLCGENAEFFNATGSGMYTNQWAVEGYGNVLFKIRNVTRFGVRLSLLPSSLS